jgi:hypothetical protein
VCTVQNQQNISQYCQTAPVVAHGRSASNSTLCPPCSTDLPYENIPMSPIPCLCAIPVYVGYRLKSPGIWNFVPYEVQFQQYLSSGLSLSLYQVEISTFMWEEGPRLRMYLKLFPNNTAYFNASQVLRLRSLFTGWLIPDSDIFGPYELINFDPGWYNNGMLPFICIYFLHFVLSGLGLQPATSILTNSKLTIKRWRIIIRYVLAFYIIVFLQGVLCIFSPSCTCIYSAP